MTERTQALVESGADIKTLVCHAANDYLHARENKAFADHYGGVDALHHELERLVIQWRETL
jgi:hypothetical protein